MLESRTVWQFSTLNMLWLFFAILLDGVTRSKETLFLLVRVKIKEGKMLTRV